MNEQNEEMWQLIPGTQGKFYNSNLGRILNLESRKIVRPYIHQSRSGKYLRVALGKKQFMVHVITAELWVPKPANQLLQKLEVHHDDHNTLNPVATNLSWKTHSENVRLWHASKLIKIDGRTIYTK